MTVSLLINLLFTIVGGVIGWKVCDWGWQNVIAEIASNPPTVEEMREHGWVREDDE